MSFDEVKSLRKEGQLEKALKIALDDWQEDKNNIWNKRALSWVYYDFSKQCANQNRLNDFLKNIEKIKSLNLPKEEKMIFDNLIWLYCAMFKNIYREKNINYQDAVALKQSLKGLYFTTPSENFSILMGALHKTFKDSKYYISLAEKSFFKYLRREDFLPTTYNEKSIMPLAEQIYNAYCKALLGEDKQKIKNTLPQMEKWIEENPNYTFLPYYKAKMEICLSEGNPLDTLIPFAKKKKNDTWIWQLMSEILEKDKELEFSCLCKALSLKSPEQFLGKTRLKMAQIFIDRKQFDQAKTEIDLVFEEKKKSGQKIPNKIQNWIGQSWYETAKRQKSNYQIYDKGKTKAEEILFENVKEEIIVVENVNYDKKIINFIESKTKRGYFSYYKILKKPKIGDILKVRLEQKDNGYWQLLSAREESGLESDCLKKISGTLKIVQSGVGFVDDVFVEKSLIEKNKLVSGQKLSALAILCFNKKKEQWGWKMIWEKSQE